MYNHVLYTPFFHESVPLDEKELLDSFTEEIHLAREQVLYFEGDHGDSMYVVRSGTLKIFREYHGVQMVLGHQFPGEAVGELEVFHYSSVRTASVAAIEETVVWRLPAPEMRSIAFRYPGLLYKTVYILSERLTQADRKIEYLAFYDVRIRTANLLLDLLTNFGVRTEKGIRIGWKLTHQHAAAMIGASRESVSRALRELQMEGVIELHKRTVYILDEERLKEEADTSNGISHDRAWHRTQSYLDHKNE
ncbi:Crp/Fnr family transcriptional regulator [Alkalicoccus chagannorensis]|uniref:Crp/Fnr family transcriptional regulator n=1 Tax=Alkalicoccus chagannorensis TaxID=427072 RepID=UPI0003FCDDF6|nr:Crp/Fnr family transcriptional regulator [Alkalicoccus chagannorensis]